MKNIFIVILIGIVIFSCSNKNKKEVFVVYKIVNTSEKKYIGIMKSNLYPEYLELKSKNLHKLSQSQKLDYIVTFFSLQYSSNNTMFFRFTDDSEITNYKIGTILIKKDNWSN